ncbi:pilus (MSHA type) biogenesis protein MshL [Acidovorax sp. NCPPB 3859]|nr:MULTISPECIES: pilus (MSHA type) biogenesis protein MshL [unclassified Acidovorax]MDA8450054.1 pilus (MSHA type) biogenesis protein MshL [Acidovorax sp. GBBC 3297]MDA8459601.1 pilus (MSHA type) biogenesis protein MshL [Acidovorax sp. GBBC 3333]MDA8464536.1 pilus (MSHA type) biogenesis protein MshL [Acidovorax sp. GBBC 3332]MDA8469671.1 pilus (MSHA type) biogenesis protein MshL [Acidovorax sp. GBBC 3299]WCM79362.1 pilus (MSHA type) biogenesis protein MshL [Acidovorax sp. GBBC 712]
MPSLPHHFRPRCALLALAAAAMLAGCASPPAPRSLQSLRPADLETPDRLREQMVAESQKLLVHQLALNQQLRQAAPAPEIAPVAPKFDPLEGKVITVAMSRATISQILAAFADSARINLIVDPAVVRAGQLSDMYLREVSLREAFTEVLRSYNVAGEIQGNTLRVTLNEEKFFNLDFLNSSTTLDLSSGGNVFGNSTGGAGGGASNALRGNLAITGTGGVKADPYQEVENNLRVILGEDMRRPTAQPSAQAPIPAAQPGAAPAMAPFSADLAEGAGTDAGFSVNRLTGTLYVKARPAKMRAVEKMLAKVQGMLRQQVYIEAQLIDVQLSDSYEFGVDWSILRGRLASGFGTSPISLSGVQGALPNTGPALARTVTLPAALIGSLTGPALGVGYQGSTSSVVLNALRSFGNLKVLSNPNVQVRNGTPAMLSVGNSIRYVSRSSSTQVVPGGGASTTTSDVQTDSVFSGVMVGVLPYMREDGRIELLVNPMQSEVDPASLALVQVNSDNRVTLPVVSYKGLTTTLNVGDGDVVVVGGLIDQRTTDRDRGAPGLSDVPVLGKLVGNQSDTHASRELVIVMRVRKL